MSQYPSPYLPPNMTPYYGASPPPNVLAPARRASVLMFILGPFLMLCGGFAISLPAILPAMLNMAPPAQATQLRQQLNQQMQNSHMSPAMFAPTMIVEGTMMLLPGIALIVLAFFVRRGSKTPAVLSLVVVGLILMFSVLSLLTVIFHPADIGGACLDMPVIAIFALLFAWLLKAVRTSSTLALAQQQYQAQYWQYQQNMQAYMAYNQQQAPPLGYPTSGYPQAPPPQGQLPQAVPAPPPPSGDTNVPPTV